ncbi:hypothetical protein KIN20_006204 [Parelaphostrongylus tenuis]|uniref:Uncharacterized protein n=1 Tax=Parelaphostrongylus tenuis TaxID=148309 RepID=A0AAD5MMN1_PARTN|nr:hypothetical protein KIN20_006204 [Parelaphostrongylus tenuis]
MPIRKHALTTRRSLYERPTNKRLVAFMRHGAKEGLKTYSAMLDGKYGCNEFEHTKMKEIIKMLLPLTIM